MHVVHVSSTKPADVGACPQATDALKVTADQLHKFGVMDYIVPEPLGGAHSDPMGTFPAIKKQILDVYQQCVLRLPDLPTIYIRTLCKT